MKRKIEDIGVGEHFTFEGHLLFIPAAAPKMDGMVFAKRVEPDTGLNPPGWWRSIPRGTLVEVSPVASVEKS